MVAPYPYLPHIVQDITTQANAALTDSAAGFELNYGYGLQADVTKFLNKAELNGISETELYPFYGYR